MFIDQSKDETDKDANKENAEKDVNKDNEEVKKKESTISLEVADAEDNSADSDDDMDVNAGLDKCFDALEKKIANEDNSDSNSVKEVESRPVEESQPTTKDKPEASTSESSPSKKSSEEVQDASEDSSEVEM